MPAILPRASFTVIEPGMDRILKKFELSFRDVMRGRQHVRRRMEEKFLPAALVEKFEKDGGAENPASIHDVESQGRAGGKLAQ
jgi:hypothetical protein